jgi:predicted neuraminidase
VGGCLAVLSQGDGYCLTNNSRDGLNRELFYPSIHQDHDGTLHVAYTHFRKAIRYMRISPDWADGDDHANTS